MITRTTTHRCKPRIDGIQTANVPHFETANGTTVVQVHGIGPFVVNYVNPADDPSNK